MSTRNDFARRREAAVRHGFAEAAAYLEVRGQREAAHLLRVRHAQLEEEGAGACAKRNAIARIEKAQQRREAREG